MRVAFAVGRLPWELEVDALELSWLRAADVCGLVPDSWETAYRTAASFSGVKREAFYPQRRRRMSGREVSKAIEAQATQRGIAGEIE